MLSGRRIVLAVTGGVAAYKSAYLARRLTEAGAELKVVMSPSSLEFVGPQTFAAITGSAPLTDLFGNDEVSPHTEYARWADLIIVAPATAATLSRAANGLSEDLISATLLTAECPILLAPAMHTEMWEKAATQRNVQTLRTDGYHLIGPNSGDLAGGDTGVGRVAEPEEIVEEAVRILDRPGDGLRVVVTAGGTREPVDPVRYLGNRSSGKMGHALANEGARRGYQVTLVTASSLPVDGAVKVIAVETAEEMLSAVGGVEAEVAVMAAAVADFRPASSSEEKLARSEGLDSIQLEATPDILASVMDRPQRPIVVGFAAETGAVDRAVEKARKKGVDLLVYNNVSESGSGFGTDTNRVVLIDSGGNTDPHDIMSKAKVASLIWDRIDLLVSQRG